jgi:hypothetical protein
MAVGPWERPLRIPMGKTSPLREAAVDAAVRVDGVAPVGGRVVADGLLPAVQADAPVRQRVAAGRVYRDRHEEARPAEGVDPGRRRQTR